MAQPRIALVLGGGGARALAHVGVLEVLERTGLNPAYFIGTSMGGVLAALAAAGYSASEILELSRSVRFPPWFIPGGLVSWDRIFGKVGRALAGRTFESLEHPLAVVSVDLEAGRQVVHHVGPLVPALRATCAVPGVLPPVEVDGRWLVDGALVNALPVDVASMFEPDLVIAARAGSHGHRRVPSLRRPWCALLGRLAQLIPNPISAMTGFEIVVRSAEIALDRQGTLAAAMVEPNVLVDGDVADTGLRDFHRLDEAVAAGRRAARLALPKLLGALHAVEFKPATPGQHVLDVDPVCDMVVHPTNSAAAITEGARTYYFCSLTCRDAFLRRRRSS
ncbi:MAG: patatin-like phospholipase family protein [Anaeromyxobacteraceae bacterium]|nr:patatin-like phospholipase family protein [Anaeromyxobacteraceae bacterium]